MRGAAIHQAARAARRRPPPRFGQRGCGPRLMCCLPAAVRACVGFAPRGRCTLEHRRSQGRGQAGQVGQFCRCCRGGADRRARIAPPAPLATTRAQSAQVPANQPCGEREEKRRKPGRAMGRARVTAGAAPEASGEKRTGAAERAALVWSVAAALRKVPGSCGPACVQAGGSRRGSAPNVQQA